MLNFRVINIETIKKKKNYFKNFKNIYRRF